MLLEHKMDAMTSQYDVTKTRTRRVGRGRHRSRSLDFRRTDRISRGPRLLSACCPEKKRTPDDES